LRYSDTIAIQSKNNLKFINKSFHKKIIIFRNWINLKKKKEIKKYKKDIKLIYCGNIGPAQDFKSINFIINQCIKNYIYLDFYGRGKLYDEIKKKSGHFIKVYDEIKIEKLDKIIRNYDGGLISLNRLHSTTNIPGKFLTYIENDLPVFGIINKNNELLKMTKKYKIGLTTSSYQKKNIEINFSTFIKNIELYKKGNFDKVKNVFSIENNLKIINNLIN